MTPEVHPNERERLASLRAYEIINADVRVAFDDIAELAASLCDAPIAMINIVDSKLQFTKASVGLDLGEIPVSEAICTHALLVEEFLEIGDTLEDPRTRNIPMCCGDPDIRFYAGALLKTEDGLPIGALCVLDNVPRELTDKQRTMLKILAKQVMKQLDLRRALITNQAMHQEVDHRVKNSLQNITAFIGLKSRTAESAEAAAVLDDVARQIGTVSLLHELLYKVDVGARINLSQYIANVVDFLSGIAPVGVSVTSDCALIDIDVDSRMAAGIGTLLNEIASNAFKHAFPSGQPGKISFSLEIDTERNLVLTGSDNGVGIAAQDDADNGLGNKLISLAARQLGGTLERETAGEGLTLRFIFPLEKQPRKPISI